MNKSCYICILIIFEKSRCRLIEWIMFWERWCVFVNQFVSCFMHWYSWFASYRIKGVIDWYFNRSKGRCIEFQFSYYILRNFFDLQNAVKLNEYFVWIGSGCGFWVSNPHPDPNTQTPKGTYPKPIPKYSKNPIPIPKTHTQILKKNKSLLYFSIFFLLK